MPDQTRGYCTRCDHAVEVEHKHAYSVRRKVKLYLYLPIILVPAFPFIAWDYVIALPVFMLYMLGIGPALMIVREPALCCECGALVSRDYRPALATAATPSSP